MKANTCHEQIHVAILLPDVTSDRHIASETSGISDLTSFVLSLFANPGCWLAPPGRGLHRPLRLLHARRHEQMLRVMVSRS